MRLIRLAGAAFFLLFATFGPSLSAQTPPKLEFEVATVKPTPPIQTIVEEIQSGKRNPGSLRSSINDTRVDIGCASLREMLTMAFGMQPHQIIGPDWLVLRNFEIHAKMPDGATKEQLPEMMQSLLAERFKLATHREIKELPVYELTVAKNGHKMKEAVHDATTLASPNDSAQNEGVTVDTQEKDGASFSLGAAGQARMRFQDGAMAIEFSRFTMQQLSSLLTALAGRPVVDRTDLKGAYQLVLEMPMTQLLRQAQKLAGISLPPSVTGASLIGGLDAPDPAGEDIFDAVRKLGLKLDSAKAPIEMLAIDHIEQTPTED